jgi:hypothetical protein
MNITRRSILIAGGTAVLAAEAVAQAATQQGREGMDAMPGPEQMQVVQRGGLYANLHDPNISELPPDAFEQLHFLSGSESRSVRHLVRSGALACPA